MTRTVPVEAAPETRWAGFPRAWLDRGFALRNRLLSSPRFQRWAARFPLTRPIARRRAGELFDLCAGFVYAQVLLACVELRLFEILRDEGPRTVPALASRLGLDPAAAARLLRAAAALRLVAPRSGGRYGLGAHGAALLGQPGVAAMIRHHRLLYADLRDPVALLRGEVRDTALRRYWAYADTPAARDLTADRVADYSDLMTASQAFIAAEILDAYPLHRHRHLLDVGGGDGVFLREAARRTPGLRLTLLDLPAVAERARNRLRPAGLAGRAEVMAGDFLTEPLPTGADVISLVRILHDHEDEAALRVLRAARAGLPDDGTLLVAEPMSARPGAEAATDAYFGFYLLAMGQGRPRTPAEIGHLLRRAGFTDIRLVPTASPLLTSLIRARPGKLTST